MGQRIPWVDAAKGFGIILVMWAHAPCPPLLKNSIYTFHIPLFFFLSGYLFTSEKYGKWNVFLKRKFATLIVPYFAFSFLNYFYWLGMRFLDPAHPGSKIPVLVPLWGTFLAKRACDGMTHNSTMWFVAALFLCEVFFFLMLLLSARKSNKLLAYLIIIALSGIYYNLRIWKMLPWGLDTIFFDVVFFGAGYLVRNKIDTLLRCFFRPYMLPVYLAINITSGLCNGPVDMFWNMYGRNHYLFFISAFSGISAVMTFFMWLRSSGLLTYLGKNTLILLAFHQFVLFPLIQRWLGGVVFLRTGHTIATLAEGAIYVVSSIILLSPIIYIINRYMPFMLGRFSSGIRLSS